MAIRAALHHRTVYEYDRLATLSAQVVRLRPAPHCRTPILSYALKIEPEDHFINWQQDPHGNFLARLVFPKPTRRLAIEVSLIAEMTVINPFDFFLEPEAEKYPFHYDDADLRALRSFLDVTESGPLAEAFLKSVDRSETQTIGFLVHLNARLQQKVRYMIRMEPGIQSPEQTLSLASGSCRDTAWLLVQLLRRLGLAARFVSGYLIQLQPDVKALDGPPGPNEDFTDLHAWAEVYLPGAGWIGLDPTSGLFAGEGHIPLAATPEPMTAAPVTGMVSECEVEFQHEMRVTRIHEDPRVTKPYTDPQWQDICDLGDRVDEELAAGDVRLTMGGEPTFVSIDDVQADEWNTAALGPEKLRLSANLLRLLRDRFAPHGFLHFGQGKWYPGESLPRWSFTCYWRTDGQPLWRNPKLAGDPAHNYGFGRLEAQQFAERLSRRLRISPEYLVTAYEDPLVYVLKERDLPVNVDPQNNKLENPEERERLRRVYERGLGEPAGFVLPLRRGYGKDGREWQTGMWMLRSRHLFLAPGDSPAGLRLPLHRLPWEPASAMQQHWVVDPMRPMNPLPVFERRQQQLNRAARTGRLPDPSNGISQPVVRTALIVEPRDGRLFIFLPPVEMAEDYIELLAAVEDTVEDLQLPAVIEGYPPPADPRLRNIKVTPDPGVIEVNVQPASSWRELVENTTSLYDLARSSRLGTEKFMLDGRHTGTGGGNHIVLGGPTASDSAFLRRPHLLKSLVGYWLNHPSLSYLFSGVFIGPTSQAPRVDETRADAVYELELAFRTLDQQVNGKLAPSDFPWLVDRVFRNLLVDVTGNTHRTEICIDKLYSPDSATGRLGLVELRAFEMPPHARMSLAQQLLVRALVARFWKKPYTETPIRWGTRLHDVFLLPYFVERDFRTVIDELRREGFAFDSSWFAPHIDFRFPRYGSVNYSGVDVELRQAIEPWYVLGEEPGTGGTTRYVDSSVERLQVRVRGIVPEDHAVLCNGRRLPLQPTGTLGDFVCGVRYRAWQPPRCLHPTIPVHTPLIFDVVDLSSQRSMGGCTYHVGHPGGRNYETFPVNANEAEARRSARFFPFGHSAGEMHVPGVEINPEFPATLDLRRT